MVKRDAGVKNQSRVVSGEGRGRRRTSGEWRVVKNQWRGVKWRVPKQLATALYSLATAFDTKQRVLAAQEDFAIGDRRSRDEELPIESVSGQDFKRFSHLQDNDISVLSRYVEFAIRAYRR